MCKANVLPPGTFPVLGARGYNFFFSQKAWNLTGRHSWKEAMFSMRQISKNFQEILTPTFSLNLTKYSASYISEEIDVIVCNTETLLSLLQRSLLICLFAVVKSTVQH